MVEPYEGLTLKERILVILVVVAVAVSLAAFIVTQIQKRQEAANQATAAPLINPDFEDGFRSVDGVGELGVGVGWFPWFKEHPEHRPEYKEETRGVGSGRVFEGESAQKQFTTFSQQDGGIRQSVKATAGDWYEFKAHAYVWSSSESNPDTSTGGKCSVMVGINPWGSWDALHRTTIWGQEARDVYNEWVQVTVTAQAWGNEISLFTRTQCEWPVKHNDSYWDAAEFGLVEWGDCPDCPECPTPEPCPTSQPCDGDCDNVTIEQFRSTIRDELDRTRWGVVP